jgi:hypothetical protein
VQQTSSASQLTATNTVLTAGGVSDTFTTTTLTTYTPASHFASGEYGYYFSLDGAGNFQDSAATTAAADGSPIGFLEGNVSTRDFTQATAGSRPSQALDTNGHHKMTFNGTSAYVRYAGAGLYAAGAATMIFGLKAGTATSGAIFCEGLSSDTNTVYAILLQAAATTVRVFIRNATGTVIAQMDVTGALSASVANIVTVIDTGSTITARVNGTAFLSASPYTRSGTLAPNQSALGALWRSTAATFWDGGMFAGIACGRAFTGTELTNAESWVWSKTNA